MRLYGRSKSLDDEQDGSINVSPLIDVVFILLIFFIVSATFVSLPGVEVVRPDAQLVVVHSQVGAFGPMQDPVEELLESLLEALPENCNVITCSVADSNTGEAYYSIPALNGRLTTLAGYTNLSSSTYMSGYTFRTELVQKQDLTLLLGTEADSPDGKAENV